MTAARARALEALHRARMQRAELALELELEEDERTRRALEAVVDLAELLCDRLELVLELLPRPALEEATSG